MDGGGGALWRRAVEECLTRGCGAAADSFLSTACPDQSMCAGRPRRRVRGGGGGRYAWVEAIIERGVPDGRSRLILYVISRYLLNVKGLSEEEAEGVIDSFIEASCRNHGNCGKIYKSWVRNVLRHVKRGGWKPWSLERLRREDPQLYEVVAAVAGSGAGGG